jgi:hypothetical protein
MVAECAAAADSEAAESTGLVDLPPDVLAHIVRHHYDDDYHMLTLPLTCAVFERLFSAGEAAAAQLASRLRQVDAAVCQPGLSVEGSNEWALAHASGALHHAKSFLCLETGVHRAHLHALAATPHGLASLRALLEYCGSTAPAPPPSPKAVTAEALFLEAEAKRLQQPASRQLTALHIHRETAGDRAARDAAAAIGLQGAASRAALRNEVASQAQRQIGTACRLTPGTSLCDHSDVMLDCAPSTDATCRRRWRLLTAQQRQQWERWANAVSRQGKQRQSVVATNAQLAAWLLTAVDATFLATTELEQHA